MARVSETTLGKIMDEAKAGPFAAAHYCERRDPDSGRRAPGVLVACKQLRMCVDADGNLVAEPTDGEGRVVRTHTCDEKPGTRALAATGEGRPPVPGGDAGGRPSPHRRDRERARLGTLSLLAAIDLLTGVAVPMAGDTHKGPDLVAFLRKLDGSYPKGDVTGPVLDNHSSHVFAGTQAYPDTVPGRLTLVLAPTHGSWPDLVESFFGKLAPDARGHPRARQEGARGEDPALPRRGRRGARAPPPGLGPRRHRPRRRGRRRHTPRGRRPQGLPPKGQGEARA